MGRTYNSRNEYKIPDGLELQPVPGDGHCFYHAVTYYLYRGEDYKALRKIVSEYVKENPEGYEGFFSKNEASNFNELIEKIKKDKWADNLEIDALMKTLNRPIIVIREDVAPYIPDDYEQYQGTPIFVLYNGSSHYNALIAQDNYNARDILKDLKENGNRAKEQALSVNSFNTQALIQALRNKIRNENVVHIIEAFLEFDIEKHTASMKEEEKADYVLAVRTQREEIDEFAKENGIDSASSSKPN